ncbi:NUDIX domain-containing protein [Kitasatospora sp. NPDC001574]
MTLPEILTTPPRRRSGNAVLVLDDDGRVLLVEPAYKSGFILPGGSAEGTEPPNESAARHLLAETGLVLDLWHVLAVDYVDAGHLPEGLNLVFWGGRVSARRAERIIVPVTEKSGLLGHHWVAPGDLHRVTGAQHRARVISALRTLESGAGIPLLLRGQPAGA